MMYGSYHIISYKWYGHQLIGAGDWVREQGMEFTACNETAHVLIAIFNIFLSSIFI